MMKDFWFSGIGVVSDSFSLLYPFYAHGHLDAQHSHNLFLSIFCESGIFGIVVFFILLYIFFKKLATGHQFFGKGNPLTTLLVAVGVGTISLLICGMFNNIFFNYRIFLMFWVILALGISARFIAKESFDAKSQKP